MRSVIPYALGVVSAVAGLVVRPSGVAGQAGGPTACSIIDTEELKRLTGLKDVLRTGPQLTDPAELPKGRSECEYLGLGFALTSPMTRENFEAKRDGQPKRGTKIQPVTGVGEAAYYWWDPKPGVLRQVGIAIRAGKSELIIMDMASSDSIEIVKPRLLTVAKSIAPKLR